MSWMSAARAEQAGGRLLDAAAELFATRGVTAVGMGDVADAAGCSRATLYRYFPNREALRAAFVDREARRVAATVAARVGDVSDPQDRLVELVVHTLAVVRSSPALAAWFETDALGAAAQFAGSSSVVGEAARRVLDDDAAAWLVRVIITFLAMPAADADEERRLVERFVAPSLTAPSLTAPSLAPPSPATPTLASHGRDHH